MKSKEKTQGQIDKETAQKIKLLPKEIQKKIEEDRRWLKKLEEEEKEDEITEPETREKGLQRLDKTGWYYPDDDEEAKLKLYEDDSGYLVPEGFTIEKDEGEEI